MGDVDIEMHLIARSAFLRDDSGRFVSAVEAGGEAAVLEIADAIAGLAIIFAPRKTGELAGSIEAIALGGTEAAAVARAGHAAPQEEGAGAHTIGAPGQVLANKEEEFFAIGPVTHPGNPATRFLTRAAAAVSPRATAIVKKYMPG